MSLSDEEKRELIAALDRLTPSQQLKVRATILAYDLPRLFWRLPQSDLVNQTVLDDFGDRLMAHHATSRQSLSKDRFEFALEASLKAAGIQAELEKNPTNRGHDITISGVPVNLKTQADKAIREDSILVSKWMELGKGDWDIEFQRQQFLTHLQGYDRIFSLRCLRKTPGHVRYELVEIPKALLLESATSLIELAVGTKQSTTPGYVRVRDKAGEVKFALYFDAGSERKLHVKGLKKNLCTVHATWDFGKDVQTAPAAPFERNMAYIETITIESELRVNCD